MRELPDVQLVPYDLSSDMHNAFEAVCADRRLTLKTDRATDLIASKIVELAKAGERDPEVLCIDVLAQLEMPAQGGLDLGVVGVQVGDVAP